MSLHEAPIGHLLRRVDRLLSDTMDATLEWYGTDRTGWQMINVLARGGPTSRGSVATALAPFLDARRVDERLDALARAGWIALDGDRIELTGAGRTAHAAIARTIDGFRDAARAGIDDNTWRTTLATLERIATNLEGFGSS